MGQEESHTIIEFLLSSSSFLICALFAVIIAVDAILPSKENIAIER